MFSDLSLIKLGINNQDLWVQVAPLVESTKN